MDGFVNRIAESKFIKTLEKISDKLSASSTFSTISGGMGATMGLIMIGAVVQIILALGTQLYRGLFQPHLCAAGIFARSWRSGHRRAAADGLDCLAL